MNKREIRTEYLQKRKSLTYAERNKLDDLLLIQFQRFSFNALHTLFSYVPSEEKAEPNTFLFADYLRFRNPYLKTAYPIIDPSSRKMSAGIAFQETEYIINSYGIAEPDTDELVDPEDVDIVFVPLLAFDLQGYRVGYGKGYYDNFLAKCSEETIKIGFSYFEALQQIQDVNDWDIPLDFCVTPTFLYAFP